MTRVKDLYAPLVIDEFGPLQFKAIRQKMIDAQIARTYINKTMSMVLKIFKWGTAEGMVNVETYQRLKAVESLRKGFTTAPERDAVRPVPIEDVNATLPHLPPVVQSMVKLHLLIGCRPSELCSIKAGMVDRSSDVWGIQLDKRKNVNRGKNRTLYLGPKAQTITTQLACNRPKRPHDARLPACGTHAARVLYTVARRQYRELRALVTDDRSY